VRSTLPEEPTTTSTRTNRRGTVDPRHGYRIEGVIGASRTIIVFAIVGTTLGALSMLVYGLIVVLKTIWHAFTETDFDIDGAKHLAVELIEMTDFFLFGMVLYVVAIGMYQLFINPYVDIPEWMRVGNLTELKTQLINVIVLLLAVSFLAIAVTWTSDRSILYFGIAISVVILALAGFNLVHDRAAHGSNSDDSSMQE
jgi:uncharacterized membrane protein YqhA